MNRTGMLAVLILMVGTVCAFSSDGPVLQITDYESVPDNVYPGTTGQLRLTIYNSGSEMATGTVIYYNYKPDETWNIYVGDIGADSQAITTIPFVAPDKADSGIMVMTVDLYYLDEDQISTKHSMSSIPIKISQYQVLEVDTISISKETIRKGESLDVELEITNTGGVMSNAVISTPENSSFSLAGTGDVLLGNIPKNSSRQVSVTLSSSSSAEEGKYTIPLTIAYLDSLQNEVSETVRIGPVMVMDSSSLFRISFEPLTSSEIGSELQYQVSIENHGDVTQSATLIIEENDVFTPVGPNTIYLDDIMPGEVRKEVLTLGIDADSASGYYVLPVILKTNGDEIVYSTGIAVQATPEVILTSETESSGGTMSTTIRIANSGNTVIRSLYVYAESTESLQVTGTDDKFIGTLNVDDFASFQVSTQSRGEGPYMLPVIVQFKDNDNKQHTLTTYVEIDGGIFAMASEDIDDSASQGPPGRSNNTLLYAGGAVIVLGVLFVGYRRWKGPK